MTQATPGGRRTIPLLLTICTLAGVAFACHGGTRTHGAPGTPSPQGTASDTNSPVDHEAARMEALEARTADLLSSAPAPEAEHFEEGPSSAALPPVTTGSTGASPPSLGMLGGSAAGGGLVHGHATGAMMARSGRSGSSGYGRGASGFRGRGGYPLAATNVPPRFNTEGYAHVPDNRFTPVTDKPLSTFSVDVDTASYANVRRFIDAGAPPPVDAVRVEEMINYFGYAYAEPTKGQPFSVYTEVASAPWNPAHRLLHVGLKGRSVEQASVPGRNLVFLIDVSGSMRSADKLPLLKRGLTMLTRQLRSSDRVAMVVYAGSTGLALESTPGDRKADILGALARLQSGGSTHGSAGIALAYEVAQEHFIKGGINRVILATDGDFNVGVTSEGALTRLIADKRKTGVFLTVLGFGRGNLQDSRMETLADKGNGNYAYIDSVAEARKVLVREAGSTLITIAKDVKLQLEFNPSLVKSYRLVGYENRVLAARDFNDDQKDAGEIGAGHTVTALYELIPADGTSASGIDPLKYQRPRPAPRPVSDELLTLKLRYKRPSGRTSRLLSAVVRDSATDHAHASEDFRWSAAVAGFGMVLRRSPHRGTASYDTVHALAESAVGADLHGDRTQLLQLIRRAATL